MLPYTVWHVKPQGHAISQGAIWWQRRNYGDPASQHLHLRRWLQYMTPCRHTLINPVAQTLSLSLSVRVLYSEEKTNMSSSLSYLLPSGGKCQCDRHKLAYMSRRGRRNKPWRFCQCNVCPTKTSQLVHNLKQLPFYSVFVSYVSIHWHRCCVSPINQGINESQTTL